MNAQQARLEALLDQAVAEHDLTGAVSTDTAMKMAAEGFDLTRLDAAINQAMVDMYVGTKENDASQS